MLPTQKTDYVNEGLGWLTGRFKGPEKPVIAGLVTTLMLSCQDLENVLWDILISRLIATSPVGDQLDQIGGLVGLPRDSLSDADYLTAIKIQIRVHRSAGTAEDIIQVAALINGGPGSHYVESYPAGFIIEMLDLVGATPPVVAQFFFYGTKAAATYGVLHYTTWPKGNDFKFISRYGGATGQGAWGSRYNSSVGGFLVAAAGI